MQLTLRHGDSRDVLKGLPEGSIGAIICDPPYELSFMGKGWDSTGIMVDPLLWGQAFRVLQPSGVVKAFGGTRTFHRMAAALAAVGFEDIHLEAWGYATGFPKSLNISKALDKLAGAKRGTKQVEYTGNALLRTNGQNTRPWMEEALKKGFHELADDTPITDASKMWKGWGTALKPAWEPVLVARKP